MRWREEEKRGGERRYNCYLHHLCILLHIYFGILISIILLLLLLGCAPEEFNIKLDEIVLW